MLASSAHYVLFALIFVRSKKRNNYQLNSVSFIKEKDEDQQHLPTPRISCFGRKMRGAILE